MTNRISRRDVLRGLGIAGTGLLLRIDTDAQGQDLVVAGQPAELRVSSISPVTVRCSVFPRDRSFEQLNTDNAVVESADWRRVSAAAAAIKAGDLHIAVSRAPLAFAISDASGSVIQKLTITDAGSLEFAIGDAPLLGFGEGGPQFDRRGDVDAMRNGQGGYQLRTHGGRVPIQWLIGTEGWAIFVHHPFGTFDLTGPQGRLTPAAPSTSPLPLDCFLV